MSKSTDTPRQDLAVPLIRRNYLLAIANGAIFTAANRLADPATVIPLLLLRLSSGLGWTVGLGHAINMIAPAVPGLLAARWVDTAPNKRNVFNWCSVARFVGAVGSAVPVLLAGTIGYKWALVLLLAFFTLRRLAQGISTQAFTYIIANSVPTTRRGSFWKWRQFLGLGLVLVFSRPLVRYFLAEDSAHAFPNNYGLLMLLAALLMGLAWLLFGMVREPPGKPAGHQLTWAQHLARGMRLVRRDTNYRRLLRAKVVLTAAGSMTPFFIVFAVEQWRFPDEIAATFIGVQILSQLVGCWISGYISDRLGNRKLMIMAGAVTLSTAVVAGFGGLFTPSGGISLGGLDLSYRMIVMVLCFVGHGLHMSELVPAYYNYIMDIAPRRKLPSYLGFASAFLVPVGVVPMLYGWLGDAFSYQSVFLLSAALSAVGLVTALRMGEPREEIMDEASWQAEALPEEKR